MHRPQRRQVAAHAVHAVDGDDGVAVVAEVVECPLEGRQVVVLERGRPRAVGLGDLGPLVQAVVGVLVEHDRVLLADQGRQDAGVEQRHRREDDGRLGAEPGGDLLLGLDVRPDAREGARRAVVGAPLVDAAAQGVEDARVAVEAEEAVGPEVDDIPAAHADPPARPGLVDREVLEVVVGVQAGEVVHEFGHAVVPQDVAEVGKWQGHESSSCATADSLRGREK